MYANDNDGFSVMNKWDCFYYKIQLDNSFYNTKI